MSGSDKRLNLDSSRRKVLGMLGGGTMMGLAGCLGGDDGGDEVEIPPADEWEQVDPDEIQEGGTLNFGHVLNPTSLDPPYSDEAPDSVVSNLIYEGLTTVDRNGNVYPWLAESFDINEINEVGPRDYEDYMREVALDDNGFAVPEDGAQVVIAHPDNQAGDDTGLALTVNETQDAIDDGVFGMRINFQLHEGVTFGNGDEMTSADVTASYERLQNSQLAAQFYGESLLAVEAVGDYEVNVYAQEPDAEAINSLPYLVFHEDQAQLPDGDLDPRSGNTPLGTGAWELVDYSDNEYWTFERRDDYWMEDYGIENKEWYDGPEGFPNGPVIDEVDLRIIPEEDTRSPALEEGEIDLTYSLTAEQRTSFLEEDGFAVPTAPGPGYLFAQMPVDVEPFTDKRVRRAVAKLIPREEIIEEFRSGWGRPAIVPVAPVAGETAAPDGDYEALEDELRDLVEFDTDAAESLVDDAGVDTPIECTFVTNGDNDERVSVVQTIVSVMNETDAFDASVETESDLTDLVLRLYGQDFHQEPTIAVVGLAGTFGPDGFIRVLHDPDNYKACCNFQVNPGTGNVDIESLRAGYNDARFTTDAAESVDYRRDQYADICEQILEESANLYIDYGLSTAIYNEDVVGSFAVYPFTQTILSYGLYAPADQVCAYLNN